MVDVDIEAVIAADMPFKDISFNANLSIILDLNMDHTTHASWQNLTWRRPSDVYGKGKYSLFDQISPEDI